MTSNTLLPLFSSPIYVGTYELKDDDIESIKKEHYASNLFGDDLRLGYMTSDRDILKRYPNLNDICNFHISSYMFDELKISRDTRYKIVQSWAYLLPPNHSGEKHGHKNSVFSGVLYLDMLENSGKISFEAPLIHDTWSTGSIEPEIDQYTIYNSREWSINPHNGMCIIFPSHVEHNVHINRTNKNRYSLSFDVIVSTKYYDV